MYLLAACISPSLQFRGKVMAILNDMALARMDPLLSHRWFYIDWWGQDTHYFFIRAEAVAHIDSDLWRLKWANSLNIISIFKFWPTDPTKKIFKNGEEISQNRWVYDQVLTILAQDRVAVFGRRDELNPITRAFPTLPRVYRMLEPSNNPPTFKKTKACEFHLYKDDHPKVDAEHEYDWGYEIVIK